MTITSPAELATIAFHSAAAAHAFAKEDADATSDHVDAICAISGAIEHAVIHWCSTVAAVDHTHPCIDSDVALMATAIRNADRPGARLWWRRIDDNDKARIASAALQAAALTIRGRRDHLEA